METYKITEKYHIYVEAINSRFWFWQSKDLQSCGCNEMMCMKVGIRPYKTCLIDYESIRVIFGMCSTRKQLCSLTSF